MGCGDYICTQRTRQEIVGKLWPHGHVFSDYKVYALLDGARDEAIEPAINKCELPYVCLYSGELSPALRLAAPYLVELEPESIVFDEWMRWGWGKAWGVFVVAPADVPIKELRKHFRRFLRIEDGAQNFLIFRFYDPRVFRLFMGGGESEGSDVLFGPVNRFLCESEDGSSFLEFGCESGKRSTDSELSFIVRYFRRPALIEAATQFCRSAALTESGAVKLAEKIVRDGEFLGFTNPDDILKYVVLVIELDELSNESRRRVKVLKALSDPLLGVPSNRLDIAIDTLVYDILDE